MARIHPATTAAAELRVTGLPHTTHRTQAPECLRFPHLDYWRRAGAHSGYTE